VQLLYSIFQKNAILNRRKLTKEHLQCESLSFLSPPCHSERSEESLKSVELLKNANAFLRGHKSCFKFEKAQCAHMLLRMTLISTL